MEDSEYELNNNQKTLLLTVFIVSCSISVLMSLLIFIFYLLYSKVQKNFASQLIITIAIMDFFTWGLRIVSSSYSLTHDFETYEEIAPPICVLSGFLFSFLNLIVFFSVLVIGYCLYSDFVFSRDISPQRHKMFAFIFFSACILSIIPFFTSSYGKIDDVKCWLVDYWERIFTFYFPLWVIILIDCYFIVKVILKLRHMQIEPHIKNKLIFKFALFPLLMFISWAPSSIRRATDSPNFQLEVFMYAVMPLQGVFNPLAYGLINSEVKDKIIAFFTCDCRKLRRNTQNSCQEIILNEANNNTHCNSIND